MNLLLAVSTGTTLLGGVLGLAAGYLAGVAEGDRKRAQEAAQREAAAAARRRDREQRWP